MKLELDHFFVLVPPGGGVADLLVSLGMEESFGREHPGQGTSNRRFELSNSMLEFIWVRDSDEALSGPARELKFVDRSSQTDSSPFGVILNRTEGGPQDRPFEGWTYQPDYFEPPMSFHVGSNSGKLVEPLCIYVPFMNPPVRETEAGVFRSLGNVKITTTANPISNTLDLAGSADRLTIESGDQHLMEVTLDDHKLGNSRDFRPDIPLVIDW